MRGAHDLLFLFCIIVLTSCKTENKGEQQVWNTKKVAKENETHNQLLDIEKEAGWTLLFDGHSLDGWHLYNKPDSTAYSAWEVKEGTLYCNAADESKTPGDLVSNKSYEDYELVFDWKISPRGNSGIFINVQERPEISTTYQSGPEYQLIEPTHMDYDVAVKRPGCLYGFTPQANEVDSKPAGLWNQSRIVQKDGKIEFYLNGKLTATQDFSSPQWKKQIAASGFSKYPAFGNAIKGQIALQNWFFEVWFRDMKIREL